MKQVGGSDLKVNDTIECWWGRDTITKLEPYTGSLGHLFKEGARIATFARNHGGMTIDHSQTFDLVEA